MPQMFQPWSTLPTPFNMNNFKYLTALLCVAYLVSAFLPECIGHMHHCQHVDGYQRVASRGWLIFASLLFGAVFYAVQKRTPICWTLIAIFVGVYLMLNFVGASIYFIWFQHMWRGGIAIAAVGIGTSLFFGFWWRNQKSYFADRP